MNQQQIEDLEKMKAFVVDRHERCGGTGYVDGGRCACMNVFRYMKELYKAGIPRTFWGARPAELEFPAVAEKWAQAYIEKMDQAVQSGALGFVYLGPNGVGKTSVAVEFLKECIVLGKRCSYVIADSLKRSLFADDDPDARRVKESEIIVVDELDKVYVKAGSDWAQKTIENFFRETIPHGKVFIVISNMTEKELAEMFGPSTWSLLSRSLKVVNFGGKDAAVVRQGSMLDRILEGDAPAIPRQVVRNAERMERNQNAKL